ncbi:hypothetical protein ZOSMA_307G00050 [Zostera marina]|uniref:Uncharacterized protein n=1 Tax=Zostera marina TaxID=29655 RepID=A0A0K9PA71_ZOSMR|nr:hypothetical protein ZOSMA_307G00050 [Zostera marina]
MHDIDRTNIDMQVVDLQYEITRDTHGIDRTYTNMQSPAESWIDGHADVISCWSKMIQSYI